MFNTDEPSERTPNLENADDPKGATSGNADEEVLDDDGDGGGEPVKTAEELKAEAEKFRKLYNDAKPKLEELNRLKDQGDDDPLGDDAQPAGEVDEQDNLDEIEELENEEMELRRQARAGSVLAKRELRRTKEMLQIRRDMADAITWQGLDAETRVKAVRIYQSPKYKGRFGSLRDVVSVLEDRRLREENKALKDRIKKYEDGGGGEGDGEGDGKRRTVKTGGPSIANGKKVEATTTTREKFERDKQAAYAKGDIATYRQLQRDLLAGKIKFR